MGIKDEPGRTNEAIQSTWHPTGLHRVLRGSDKSLCHVLKHKDRVDSVIRYASYHDPTESSKDTSGHAIGLTDQNGKLWVRLLPDWILRHEVIPTHRTGNG